MDQEPPIFVFDDVRVDTLAHRVEKAGVERALEPKAFAVLLEFLAHPGELLGRDALLDAVWGHRHVTPGVLNRVVASLRRELGDDPATPRYIETVHGLGYRFVATLAEVRRQAIGAAPESAPAVPRRRREDIVSSPGVRRFTLLHALVTLAALIVVGVALLLAVRVGERNAASSVVRSIAVLPFTARGGDPDLVAAVEGMAKSLTDAFARQPDLRVAGRESVFALGRGRRSPQEVAEALDVDYVLGGEAQPVAGALTLRVSLWHRGDRAPLWMDEQNLPREQMFRLIVPLMRRVEDSLGASQATPEMRASVSTQDLYWLGRRYWYQRTSASLARSLGYFQQAVAQDGAFAAGYCGIADAYMLLYEYGDQSLDEASLRARSAIARAKELAPDLADAWASEGLLLLDEGDAPAAVRALAHALELEPKLPTARLWYGDALAYAGRVREARAWHVEVEREDPINPILQTYLGVDALLSGEEAEATRHLRRAIELNGDYAEPYWQLALQHELHGRLRDAAAVYAEVQAKRDDPWTAIYASYNELLAGDAAAADRWMEDIGDLSSIDRDEARAWSNWLQDRRGLLRADLERLPGGATSARRDALLARIRLFEGDDAGARELYGRLFNDARWHRYRSRPS
ncbi:winged helix-turn-helix domain-containing tetratricopeptide repeat protein [Dokdonella sp.]|uniref:winged helix-turn-helix domain-containing tetratricopeptide repeat protein n=1 Tax=Dokdonella sp. TaxID=2291710 RepID=UPI0037841558